MHGLWTRVDVVKDLALDLECAMSAKFKELDAQASKLNEVEDENYREYLSESYADDHYSYTNEWIPVIRESLLLSICSSFEYHLGRLCDKYGETCGSNFRISDMKDRGITRCRNFLLRLGIDKAAFGDAWNRLQDIYKVRNRIAHAGSISDCSTQSAIKSETDVFEAVENKAYSIMIKENGIENVCELMTEALRNINRHLFEPIKN